MKYNIFGIGFDELSNFFNDFEEVVDTGDEILYQTKETFHQDDDDLSFDYKYIVDACYCDGKLFYTLSLAVLPTSCCKDYIDNLFGETDLDDVNEVSLFDTYVTGGSTIDFGSCSEDCEDEYDFEWNKDILNKIASVYKTMDALRGFYIDKSWNMIGTTGWDTIKHCIKGEKLFKF